VKRWWIVVDMTKISPTTCTWCTERYRKLQGMTHQTCIGIIWSPGSRIHGSQMVTYGGQKVRV